MTKTKTTTPVWLRSLCLVLSVALIACDPSSVAAATSAYDVDIVVEGLNRPWGMAFLPDGRLLVTERPGGMQLIDIEASSSQAISGLPEVDARGQGGLLDVALHPNFADNAWVYMTWAGNNDEGLTATYLGRARLDLETLTLNDTEVLHIAGPHVNSVAHYGSRIVFDADNRLYMTVGDRNNKDFGPNHVSQDRSNYIGTTLRFEDDGSIPADNPFVNDSEVRDAIFSFGHRNSQGMAIHPETGELWQNEHGERNGDEVNVIQAGGNYGWPIASYGVDYRTGQRFAEFPEDNPDTINPVFWWGQDHPEGFPPSGFAFYDGDAFPEWRGNALMGTLAHRHLGRFAIDGHNVSVEERLLDGRGWRIRDVAVGPEDGFVYVLVDDASAPLVRLRPAAQ